MSVPPVGDVGEGCPRSDEIPRGVGVTTEVFDIVGDEDGDEVAILGDLGIIDGGEGPLPNVGSVAVVDEGGLIRLAWCAIIAWCAAAAWWTALHCENNAGGSDSSGGSGTCARCGIPQNCCLLFAPFLMHPYSNTLFPALSFPCFLPCPLHSG